MTNKIKKIFVIIVGLVIALIGLSLLYLNVLSFGTLELYTSDYIDNNNYQLIIGKLSYQEEATDPDMKVSAPSSVLIRSVEMVQYLEEDGKATMVLANHQLESFELDGKTYENPDFNSVLTPMVFYTDTYIYNGNLKLPENVIETFVYDDDFTKAQLKELPDVENDYQLVSNDTSYITEGDDWKIGDIKVTYYYLDTETLDEISVIGKVKEGNVDLSCKDSLIKASGLDYDVAKSLLIDDPTVYYILIVAGLAIVLIPFVLKKKFQ